jgi:hypothetical protein
LKKENSSFISDWPPYYPELSLIETIWSQFMKDVGAKCPMTRPELEAAAKEAWRELDQAIIDRHVVGFSSMWHRVIESI